jgi:hypothetical protein
MAPGLASKARTKLIDSAELEDACVLRKNRLKSRLQRKNATPNLFLRLQYITTSLSLPYKSGICLPVSAYSLSTS